MDLKWDMSIELAFDPMVFKLIVRSFSGFRTLEYFGILKIAGP